MHPPIRAPVPDGAHAVVSELVRVEHTSPRTVYLAALILLLHRRTGQADICIEAAVNTRPKHPGFERVQGLFLTWMLCRIDVSGCTTLREVVRKTEDAVAAADRHFIIDDYYRLVPHTVRRVVFNYVSALEPEPVIDNLRLVVPKAQEIRAGDGRGT